MIVVRAAAALVAVAVAISGSAKAAGPQHAFKLGFWSGGAYTDERTGEFTHCSAGVAYESGINMFILVTAGYHWWLGFIDPDWVFPPKSRIEVGLRLDGGIALPRFGTVPGKHLMLVPLPDNAKLVDDLRRSSELTLTAAGKMFRFKLTDASAVLNELSDCVHRATALAAGSYTTLSSPAAAASPEGKLTSAGPPIPTAPISPAKPPLAAAVDATPKPELPAPPAAASRPPGPQASREPPAASPPAVSPKTALPAAVLAPAPQAPATPAAPEVPAAGAAPPFAPLPQWITVRRPTALEEIKLAQDFFTTARLPNARLVMADKPAALAGFAAVWRSDKVAGAVKIIPPGPEVSGIGIASDLIAVDPRMCKGNFAAARSSAAIGGSLVFSAVLSCTEADEQRSAQYFITSRRQGGFVVFAVVGSRAAGVAPSSDQQRIDLFTRAAVRAARNDG